MSLAPFRGGNPSAFDMGLALKPSALAASSTPHMRAIFLGLVSTVLAADAACSAAAAHGEKGGSRRIVGDVEGGPAGADG